ncbi:MAG TPA: hypothetical protein PK812_05280 [Beijerinckiaceae bacterium]|nr:hypothetical protein [Beijerinckiaceae bacterium]
MTPHARQVLETMLAQARQAAAQHLQSVADAPDPALSRVIGIADPALCRRIAATPRVARRIADRLRTATADEIARARTSTLADALPTDPDAIRLADADDEMADAAASDGKAEAVPTPLPEAERLLRMIAAAIRLSSSGALLGRDEIDDALSLYGVEAVDFALQSRSDVPAWMREAAGSRSDIHRQFAASCIVCLAESLPSPASAGMIDAVQVHDPVPIVGSQPRAGAERLAASAVTFAASYVPGNAADAAEMM